MPEDHFDEPVAERYDESVAEMFEPAAIDPLVDFLAELAGEGAALELGIGTGRITLPLARRGVKVSGHRPLVGDGCATESQAGRRAHRGEPAELDLMARLAGMSRRERWGGWKREPFTSRSTTHVLRFGEKPAA